MKNERSKRSVRIEFVVSEQESELIKERMEQIGVTNLSAYLRKMAVDGYIINLDMTDIQEMTRLLRICSNNLNQYARQGRKAGRCGCRIRQIGIIRKGRQIHRTRHRALWQPHRPRLFRAGRCTL